MISFKTIVIAVLGVIFPYALPLASLEFEFLSSIVDTVLQMNPIYMPVLCGYIGVRLYKETDKILFPSLIFNLFLFITAYSLTQKIFDSIERSLADALIGLLLFGPVIYSVIITPIAAVIYKKSNKNSQ